MAQAQPQSGATVFLMPGLFNETVHLLLQARYYFENEGRMEEAALDLFYRPFFASEMSRITLRLSCVMAGFLYKKRFWQGN